MKKIKKIKKYKKKIINLMKKVSKELHFLRTPVSEILICSAPPGFIRQLDRRIKQGGGIAHDRRFGGAMKTKKKQQKSLFSFFVCFCEVRIAF